MEETSRKTAFLLIGGNEGDRADYLARARSAIGTRCGQLAAQSSLYETAAWGLEAQPHFYNQALRIETHLSPEELLRTTLSIEEELGRKRQIKYGQRTIDIDILLYANEVVQLPNLQVPHPALPDRRFALECLNEIAADVVHPLLHKPVHQLLSECTDRLTVHKIS